MYPFRTQVRHRCPNRCLDTIGIQTANSLLLNPTQISEMRNVYTGTEAITDIPYAEPGRMESAQNEPN